jgi:hypothetical protein
MFARTSAFVLALGAVLALPAHAQSGLRLPQRADGLDPSFARGWLAPEYDHFGFATYRWRDDGRAAASRMHWSYSFTERASLGMALGQGRELDEQRQQFSLFGSYWLSPDWALSAETTTGRDAGGVLRLQDIRIGVQRRF